MAYFQPSHYGILPHTAEDHLAGRIRLSIFIIAGECGGLPALIWALCFLQRHFKSGGRISALIIMLLLSDLLELLLNPYIVIILLQDENLAFRCNQPGQLGLVWSPPVQHFRQIHSLRSTMAHLLFSQYTYSLNQQRFLPGKIRLSISLITAECGGLPALVWALRVLYRRYKSGGRIADLIIMLLLSDLLELLLNPYIVTKLLQDENCWDTSSTCRILTSLWTGSLIYGLLLQQVVALEGALTFRHPLCSAHAFFPACSIITSITVFIFIFLCELFGVTVVLILCVPFIFIMNAASCIVTCRAPTQVDTIPYRTSKPSYAVLGIVSLTLTLHVSTFLWSFGDVLTVVAILMSLRVMTDPLLCVLVYRKMQTPQTQVEHRTEV